MRLPMYDVRGTMYDLGSLRALRGEAERVRAGCRQTVHGRSYRGTGDGGGRRGLPMYDVRGTMYDLGSLRALRGEAERVRRETFKTIITGTNVFG